MVAWEAAISRPARAPFGYTWARMPFAMLLWPPAAKNKL